MSSNITEWSRDHVKELRARGFDWDDVEHDEGEDEVRLYRGTNCIHSVSFEIPEEADAFASVACFGI